MSGAPARLAPRGDLPRDSEPYRTIGPFNPATLPAGLTAEHRLKPGVWALVELTQGAIEFLWDDAKGGRHTLSAPAALVVPPEVAHHVETQSDFSLTISFHAD